MTQPYVPLRVFSSFTMLEGAMEPKAIAERAAKLGFPAVALTDRNGLYAAMAFTEACSAKGVQPIVGAMLAVARPPEIGQHAVDWLVLLAKDEQGYAQPLPSRLVGAPRSSGRAGPARCLRGPREVERGPDRADRGLGGRARPAACRWPEGQGDDLSRPPAGALSRIGCTSRSSAATTQSRRRPKRR